MILSICDLLFDPIKQSNLLSATLITVAVITPSTKSFKTWRQYGPGVLWRFFGVFGEAGARRSAKVAENLGNVLNKHLCGQSCCSDGKLSNRAAQVASGRWN
jgi:hypothetical protein